MSSTEPRKNTRHRNSELVSIFQRPAILGANTFGAQLAAVFANAGIRVRLYDKPHAQSANFLAEQAIAELLRNSAVVFNGPEAINYIEARNFHDHWALLGEHDLVIESLPDELSSKQGLWSRIAPALARDCVLLSHSAGLSINEIGLALPAGLRSRFMGVHFFRPARFQRLVEVIPTQRSDARLADKVSAYFRSHFGFEVISVLDNANYIATRLILGLSLIAFYHKEKFNINLATFEALTQLLMGRAMGGLCHLLDYIGLDRTQSMAERISGSERTHFGDLLQFPTILNDMIASGRLGRTEQFGFYNYAFKPHLLIGIDGKYVGQANIEATLYTLYGQRDWAALNQLTAPNAKFICAVLRDWLQYSAYLTQVADISAEKIDVILKQGFSWQIGIYELLQSFGSVNVARSCEQAAHNGLIKYELTPLWQQKHQSVGCRIQTSNPFIPEARALYNRDASHSWVYRDSMLVWQPREDCIDSAEATVTELLEACEYARQAELYLLIYHHGSSLGNIDALLTQPARVEPMIALHKLLSELIIALRIHPRGVMMSLSGVLDDIGVSLAMQADQLLFDADVRWHLKAPLLGLPLLGGVWFEWLRRLPYLTQQQNLEQVHAVLLRSVSLQPYGDFLYGRTSGILRAHDMVSHSKQLLARNTYDQATTWCQIGFTRIMRHAIYQLPPDDIALLEQRANSSDQPTLYRALLGLLTGQPKNTTLTLQMLLEQERELLTALVSKR